MHPADALAERLGLPVRDLGQFAQALVHSSWLHEHPDAAPGHNERLEFLGDAVVNLAVSESLYRRHPNDDEGVLSARRAAIVSTPGLARLAARLDLGSFILLGEGEAQRGGRVRPSLLASAFEALVGAIYLDLGWETARDWIHALAAEELAADSALIALKSPKSRLQEHTQRTTGDRPVYRLLEAVGPDHAKQFRIEVVVDGRSIGVGEGPSRRIAETSAAAQALDTIRRERQAARVARSARPRADASAFEDHPDPDAASAFGEGLAPAGATGTGEAADAGWQADARGGGPHPGPDPAAAGEAGSADTFGEAGSADTFGEAGSPDIAGSAS